MTEEEMVSISKLEYRALLKAERDLYLLEAGGVDNWDGYWDSLHPDGDEDDEDDA